MYFDEDEYTFLTEQLPTIELIVKNSAISAISIPVRDRILEIAKKKNLIDCSKCNTSIYLAVTRLYSRYIIEKNTIEDAKRLCRKKKKQ